MSIPKIINQIKASLPQNVTLVAVSKTYDEPYLQEAYDAGQRVFGESKPQEMCRKYDNLPKDIEWHMIGHLQTNKVKYIAPFVSLIHSVHSVKLLAEINKQAEKCGRIIDVLLEVFVAEEETKHGFQPNEIIELFASNNLKQYTHVNIKGLMCIGTFTHNTEQTRREFMSVKNLYDTISATQTGFDTLSMGMSGDYDLAVECGSTMIRVGSMIFGSRV